MSTPDESLAAQAGLAQEPALDGDGGTSAVSHGADETDVESAVTSDTLEPLADLPDEPGEAHVAAYAAAADELARRLDGSATGHDDGSP